MDANFVEDVADYLKCVVCHLVLKDPILFVACGHRLCKQCFDDMKDYATSKSMKLLCPHDRKEVDIEKVVDDIGISRVVLDLKVTCNHSNEGCPWTGELRNLQQHLDKGCSALILKELVKRVEACEEKLQQKDKEIALLRQEVLNGQSQIKVLQGELHEMRNKIAPAPETPDEPPGNDAKRVLRKRDASGKRILCPSNENPSNIIDSPQPEIEQNNEFLECIKALQKHVMNVDDFVPQKHTMFTWKLTNYAYHKEIGKAVYSPRFYCALQGHCCMLVVIWGVNRDHLGVFLKICKGVRGDIPDDMFDMEVKIETYDKNGKNKVLAMKRTQVQENSDNLLIKPGEDSSIGLGRTRFLSMPALRDFIIDDTFTVNCTLDAN